MQLIKKYHLLSLLLLLAVLLFFYFPVLFLDRTLQGPEMSRMNQELKSFPSAQSILTDMVTPQIFNNEQLTATVNDFPYDIYVGNSYRSGSIPLWNPHQGIGFPFVSQYLTAAFFPTRIIQSLFPASIRDWFFIANIWIAGVLSYLFFIQTGTNRLSAFWGAVFYMGSGTFSWFMALQEYMDAAMVLPLVLLGTYYLAHKITGARITLLAIATALMLFAGHPEVEFYAFVLCGCYFIFQTKITQPTFALQIKHAIYYFFATLLGFMIASPQLLLFLQVFLHAFSLHASSVKSNPVFSGAWLFMSPGIFLPKLLDWPIMPPIVPDTGPWEFLGSYIGIIPVFFLILGCLYIRRGIKKDFLFFLIFGLVFQLMNYDIWPFGYIQDFPLFSHAGSFRWGGCAWAFSWISASTYAFDYVQQHKLTDDDLKRCIKYTLIFISIILYLCILPNTKQLVIQTPYITMSSSDYFHPWLMATVCLIFAATSVSLISTTLLKHRNNKYSWLVILGITIVSGWYWLPKGSFVTPWFIRHISVSLNYSLTQIISLLLAVLFLFSLLPILHKKIVKFIFLFLLLFIASVSYELITLPGYPRYFSVEKQTPFIEYLQKKAGYNRIFGLEAVLMPSYASLYGLYDIRALIPLSYITYQHFFLDYIKQQDAFDFKNWMDGNRFWNRISIQAAMTPVKFNDAFPKAIDMLGVKYLLTPKAENPEWMAIVYPFWMKQLQLVYSDPHVNIYENTTALPRVFIVSHYQFANSFQEAQADAMSNAVDVAQTAILEKNTFIPAENSQTLSAHARIIHYYNNSVDIVSNSNKPALLVLSDMDYVGWHATIDGKPAKIVLVNGLLRGVFIPAGKHQIHFYYFPLVLKMGLILMMISLLICLILIIMIK